MKRSRFIIVWFGLIALAGVAQARIGAVTTAASTSSAFVARSSTRTSQSGCPLIFPDRPVVVAPNQEDDKPISLTEEAVNSQGETPDELKDDFVYYLRALEEPVLEFSDFDKSAS